MSLHRHHISYKLNWIVSIPEFYHFLIHVPAAFGLSGTAWWTGKYGKSCVHYQNKRAKSLNLRWLLGYPNLLQMILNLIAFLIWGEVGKFVGLVILLICFQNFFFHILLGFLILEFL